MATRGYIFGHECVWSEEEGTWLYADTGKPAYRWGGDTPRPCPRCDLPPTDDGLEPCLGRIEGATGACCGHGIHLGYIAWPTAGVASPWWKGAYLIQEEQSLRGSTRSMGPSWEGKE